jgi:hypothetical protein
VLEHPIEVHYRIGKSGCGVTALSLNGQSLTFAHAPNPHRRGAALIAKQSFIERLKRDGNTLSITLGE